ncbi:hypothetical protein [Crocosphaera sp. Alani8]|uniref:hypothetical protein n=1 Tax=Crocosphaera sp. Alani8 TaxID=3038952 RepID=UPI00313DB8B0
MDILTEAEYEAKAEPILRKVVVNDDPFRNPFSPNITERLILFRCEPYLEFNLIEGLITAASYLGDTHCYLRNFSLLIDPETKIIEPQNYYMSLSEFYEEQVGAGLNIDFSFWIDYIIYSPQGTWGLMISHESHGMLGGSPQFINKIREFVPNLDNQIQLFLQKFQSIKRHIPGARLEWLPGLLTHVYGQKKGKKLLQEAELS